MAQLRQNHTKQSKGLQTSFRLVLFLIFAVIMLVGGIYYFKHLPSPTVHASLDSDTDYSLRTYLPSHTGELVHHAHYTLSYVENHEQGEWVAYTMDRKMLNTPNVPRERDFMPDPKVSTGSAYDNDYRGSGYTRGHLVPAGDMAFDAVAMKESFYMSNMSPQLRQFNNGIWKELEENIRDWTYKADRLYIITGPIFDNPIKSIGKKNKVTVPSAFYKVLLDYEHPERKAIGFIIPHELSEQRLEEYMVSVDELERITGLDFFNGMINDTEEEKIESTMDKSKWNVSDKRYQLRISKWNYE